METKFKITSELSEHLRIHAYTRVRRFLAEIYNNCFVANSEIIKNILPQYFFNLGGTGTKKTSKCICDKFFFVGLFFFMIVAFASCKGTGFGELVGVSGRGKWTEPTPRGMNFIHQGSFNLGANDEDITGSNNPVKTVSVDAFWMDDTEITNNEYRQFVYWVRDSIARDLLSKQYPQFLNNGNINWKEKIDWEDPDYQQAMDGIYIPDYERFYSQKNVDPRKLFYEFWWIDLQQAAKRSNSYDFNNQRYNGSVYDSIGELKPIEDRSSFIFHNVENVYPDTLCWNRDFTYSYNDPRTRNYFRHPGFDDYPVVGVTWKQATAFCNWRTRHRNNFLSSHGLTIVDDYRLPTEAEWEFAARGDRQSSMFPWGGYYTRDEKGVFLANFKPLRGNYVEDGGITTMNVRSFEANDFGLYDMAGNVAEWTSNAYDESAYDIIHDLNPNYQYNARPDDPPAMKRKVIRGGSWKDISTFQQVATRSYEYQDTAKSYIGFRCVRSSFCDVFEVPSARK